MEFIQEDIQKYNEFIKNSQRIQNIIEKFEKHVNKSELKDYGKLSMLVVGEQPGKFPWWLHYFQKEIGVTKFNLVEICETYVNELKNDKYFSDINLVTGDIREVDILFPDENFDIILWADGPEHLNEEDSVKTIRNLMIKTNIILLMESPKGKYINKPTKENPWEEHKQDISLKYFEKNFGSELMVEYSEDITCSKIFGIKAYKNWQKRINSSEINNIKKEQENVVKIKEIESDFISEQQELSEQAIEEIRTEIVNPDVIVKDLNNIPETNSVSPANIRNFTKTCSVCNKDLHVSKFKKGSSVCRSCSKK